MLPIRVSTCCTKDEHLWGDCQAVPGLPGAAGWWVFLEHTLLHQLRFALSKSKRLSPFIGWAEGTSGRDAHCKNLMRPRDALAPPVFRTRTADPEFGEQKIRAVPRFGSCNAR